MLTDREMKKNGFTKVGEEYHHPWGNGFSPPELVESFPSELIVIPREDNIEVMEVVPKEGLVHSSRGKLDFDKFVAGYGNIGIVTLTQTGDALVYRVTVDGDQLSRAGGMLGDAVHFSLVPFLRDGMRTFADVADSERYGNYSNIQSLQKYDPKGRGSFVGFGGYEHREASPRKTWAEWRRRVRKRELEIPASLHDVDFRAASIVAFNGCSVTYGGKTGTGRGWVSPTLGKDGLATAELSAHDLEGLDFNRLIVFVPMGQYGGCYNQLMQRRFGKIEEYGKGLVVPGDFDWDETTGKLRDPANLQDVEVAVADDHYTVKADGFSMRTDVQKCSECGRPYWHFGVIIGRTGLDYPFGSGAGMGYSHLSDNGDIIICGKECAESYTEKQMAEHKIVTETQAREFALDYAERENIKHNGREVTGFGNEWNAFYWVNFTRRTGPVMRAVGHVDFDRDSNVTADVRY